MNGQRVVVGCEVAEDDGFRARTAPLGNETAPLRFAVASCQHYEAGFYTAYAHMAREELDLVTHLGDYIYEYAGSTGNVRQHVGLEVRTLDDIAGGTPNTSPTRC